MPKTTTRTTTTPEPTTPEPTDELEGLEAHSRRLRDELEEAVRQDPLAPALLAWTDDLGRDRGRRVESWEIERAGKAVADLLDARDERTEEELELARAASAQGAG